MSVADMVTTDPRQAQPRVYAQPGEIAPGLFLHPAFVNTYALSTPAGLLLVDPGIGLSSKTVHRVVREWKPDPLVAAVYTHGHADHAFGLRAFLKAGDQPQIIAQENCPRRFSR